MLASLALAAAALRAPLARGAEPGPPVARVGVLNDNDPFSFAGPDGAPQGFAVDLLAAIEQEARLRLERRVGPTGEINRAFETGEIDLLQSYVPSEERRKFAAFSEPYLSLNGSIFARSDAGEITRLADLRGRRVLVHRGSIGAQLLERTGLAASIVYAESVEDAFRRVEAGEGDATLAARLTGLVTVKRLGLRRVVPVGAPLENYRVDYCFAVRLAPDGAPRGGNLLEKLNGGLATLRRSGGFDAVYRRWFGHVDETRFDETDLARAVAAGLFVAFVVVLWAFFRQRRLRKRIAAQSDELRENEERFRGVFECSLGGLLLLDGVPGPGVPTVVLEANPTAGRLLGSAPPVGRGVAWSRAYPTDAALLAAIGAALAPGAAPEFEVQRVDSPGAEWLRVSVSRAGGHVLVGLADLTEVKATEERLRRAQKLEAIGTLAAGIAHDFNNILTSILGNAELARLETAADHPARTSLDEILRGSERARVLVRQILSFSRDAEARRELVKLAPLVEETLRFIRAAAPSTIELRFAPAAAPAAILGDATQLHQVLMNLCTNAVHAMRGRTGRLEIIEELVVVDGTDAARRGGFTPGPHVRLTVRDNGCGMPPAVRERIFEPFFTTKNPGEGTGLGLAVVHGIVRAHGGVIDVASRAGEGTEFFVWFPLAPASADAAPRETAADAPVGAGERVLFIDDEPAITQMARAALTRLGYSVVAHSDPRAALAELERAGTSFDLVFTDLTMPHLTGFDVADRVQHLRPGCPVVVASGFLSEDDVARARSLDVARLIDKPLSVAKIGRAVADGLRRRAG